MEYKNFSTNENLNIKSEHQVLCTIKQEKPDETFATILPADSEAIVPVIKLEIRYGDPLAINNHDSKEIFHEVQSESSKCCSVVGVHENCESVNFSKDIHVNGDSFKNSNNFDDSDSRTSNSVDENSGNETVCYSEEESEEIIADGGKSLSRDQTSITKDTTNEQKIVKNRKNRCIKSHNRKDRKDLAKTRTYTCTLCERKFDRKQRLASHMCRHKGVKPHTCDICSEMYYAKEQLDRHRKSHGDASEKSADKIYSCITCGKSYSLKSSLKRHKEVAHPNDGSKKPLFSCNLCDKSFTYSAGLSRHNKVKHRDIFPNKGRWYICEVCGAEFPAITGLKIHILIHDSARPKNNKKFVCDHCGKVYGYASNLKSHVLNSHGNSTKNSCGVCGKKLSSSQNLKRHMLTHENKKPYQCPLCLKCFSQSNNLKAHTRLHTGEKPHACKTCGKKYVQKSTLKFHMRSVHGVK